LAQALRTRKEHALRSMALRRCLVLIAVAAVCAVIVSFRVRETPGRKIIASATTDVTIQGEAPETPGWKIIASATTDVTIQGEAPETPGWKTITVYAGPHTLGGKRGQSHGQVGQDWLVATLLGCKSDGYFVDLAAHDYMHSSNSLMLERDFGWNGICMEANLHYMPGYAHRRCKVVVGAAGSPKDKKVSFAMRKGLSGIIGKEFDNQVQEGEMVELRLLPLSDVLTEMRAPTLIDYLSLDVEGAESIAMQGFSWEKYRFAVITVERPKPDLQQKFLEHGYELLRVNSDFGDETWISTSLPNFAAVRHSWSWNCTRKRCKQGRGDCHLKSCKEWLTSSRSSCINTYARMKTSEGPEWKTFGFYVGPHKLLGKRGQMHSQEGQDWLVATVLGCRSSGYFVDAASHDPMTYSNSLMLERDFGWNGICIEGFKANMTYMYGYAGRRCKLLWGAAGSPQDNYKKQKRVAPLAKVLAEMSGPITIDYLSLDGADSIVMQDFPWEKYRFLVITVKRPKPDLQQKLRDHSYLLLRATSKLGDETWISTSLPNIQAIMHSWKWDYAKMPEDHPTSCMIGKGYPKPDALTLPL